MSARTRYFVIASLLVLAVGLGTGLVAYFVGLPGVDGIRGGPDELQYVPPTASLVAFADVRAVMASDVRRRLHEALPPHENGQQELESRTGINVETDIDRVIAFADSTADPGGAGASGLVLARGRFDAVRIEALMREHGAAVEEYKGKRLFVSTVGGRGDGADGAPKPAFGLTFLEPGLTALGSARLLRAAVDLQDGGPDVTDNPELMGFVRSLQGANNAWVVGRFDALTSQAKLPDELANRLPPLTWFSVGTHIDGGITGVVSAEARDETGAANLRDVVRGFLALAKLQTTSHPELEAAVQSLAIDGQGTTVTLSFAIPSEVFALLGETARSR